MKLLSLLFFMLFSISIFATPSEDLIKELNSLNTMQAKFTQTTTTEKSKENQVASGTMALQKPGKFRWETLKPNEQLILADGKWIWIYDKDLEQATKQSQATTNSNNPALFLSGETDNIDKRFKITFDQDHFVLKAKTDDDMFQSMSLYFSEGSIQKMVVKTRLDQSSEFSFSDISKNKKLSNRIFTFSPPKGTDIIQN